MRRCVLGGLVALGLVGCHSTEHVLQVSNLGAEPVRLEVRYTEVIDTSGPFDDEERILIRDVIRLFDIPAEATLRFTFPPEELVVLVTRISDGGILYSRDLDHEDFHEEHGTVEILVSP